MAAYKRTQSKAVSLAVFITALLVIVIDLIAIWVPYWVEFFSGDEKLDFSFGLLNRRIGGETIRQEYDDCEEAIVGIIGGLALDCDTIRDGTLGTVAMLFLAAIFMAFGLIYTFLNICGVRYSPGIMRVLFGFAMVFHIVAIVLYPTAVFPEWPDNVLIETKLAWGWGITFVSAVGNMVCIFLEK